MGRENQRNDGRVQSSEECRGIGDALGQGNLFNGVCVEESKGKIKTKNKEDSEPQAGQDVSELEGGRPANGNESQAIGTSGNEKSSRPVEGVVREHGLKSQEKGATEDPHSRVTGSTILKMIERQGYKCLLTGLDLTPKTASIDHRIPLSKGGNHTLGNAQIVHRVINRMKGSLDQDEFVEMCVLVAENVKGT